MKYARFLTILLVISVSCYGFSLQEPLRLKSQDEAKLKSLMQILQRRLDQSRLRANLAGAQVGFSFVTDGDNPKYVSGSVASGVIDLQSNVPLKTTDRFLTGSIGKTFVSALALLLVQEGRLNLDDKIEKWLGSEAWFSKLPNAKTITFRMLLNHSSGVENHVETESFQKQLLKSSSRNINHDELVAFILNKKPLFAAGSGYNYADTNYILAGMIIEKITSKPLYDSINERLLKPYKLDNTIPADSVTLPNVVTGYVEGKPVIVAGKFTLNPQWEWAGGGFASTAEDIARWGAQLYNGDVLTAASMEQMFSSTSTGEGAGYGLGTMITRSKWGRSYGHDGEFPGYLSDMRYYTKYKLAVSVLVNSDENPAVNAFVVTASDDFAGLIINATANRQLSQADQNRMQKFAETWLDLIYSGRFDESWEQLAESLKTRYAKERWREVIKSTLEGAGKLQSRKPKIIAYADVEGKTVLVDFETTFSKTTIKSETVTLEVNRDDLKVKAFSRH